MRDVRLRAKRYGGSAEALAKADGMRKKRKGAPLSQRAQSATRDPQSGSPIVNRESNRQSSIDDGNRL
jgi:hypothetical protein